MSVEIKARIGLYGEHDVEVEVLLFGEFEAGGTGTVNGHWVVANWEVTSDEEISEEVRFKVEREIMDCDWSNAFECQVERDKTDHLLHKAGL